MNDFNLIGFLEQIVEKNVSDIHFRIGHPPIVRKDGHILKTNLEEISSKDMNFILTEILHNKNIKDFENCLNMDFTYEIKDLARFRINYARSLGEHSLVMRVIPYNVPSLEEINLPNALSKLTEYNNGIILVTGPTGCGKTTTIASILEYINKNYQKHIVTLEDPVEFIFTNKRSVVTQREIALDTRDYQEGVKYSLRQDPDVILIGELRDRNTVLNALKAAETGHLVFSTLHTTDAVQTVNRIINMFEPSEREYIRGQLAETLRCTIAQKLIQKANGEGRVPATEIMVVTSTIKDYIVKDKLKNVYELLKNDSQDLMVTMNLSLYELYSKGLITKQEAIIASDNKPELLSLIKGAYYGVK